MFVSIRPEHDSRHEAFWLLTAGLLALLVVALAASTAGAGNEVVPDDGPKTAYVVSPWHGVFRAAPEYGDLPYVEEGSRVEPGTVVGRISEMVTGGPYGDILIPAGVRGTIVRVMVQDGQMVAIGQRLFEIAPDPEPVTP